MLMPKKVKYRKQMRGVNKGLALRGFTIAYGDYALKAMDRGLLTSRQIEAARKAVSHATKRGGKLWIRVFPDKAIAKKANETRMGSGKSPTDHYACVVKPGRILFELSGTTSEVAERALGRAARKLPLKTRFIKEEA
ncbi:MAG: 50S ribosomal protein L16 [bacterium]